MVAMLDGISGCKALIYVCFGKKFFNNSKENLNVKFNVIPWTLCLLGETVAFIRSHFVLGFLVFRENISFLNCLTTRMTLYLNDNTENL